MALEVEELRAAVAGQSRDKAAQLDVSVSGSLPDIQSSAWIPYRASGDIGQLGAGEAGGNEGNQGVGELHLDKMNLVKIRDVRNGVSEKTVKCVLASADELARRRKVLDGRRPSYKLCQSHILHLHGERNPLAGSHGRLARGTITCLRMLNGRQSTSKQAKAAVDSDP